MPGGVIHGIPDGGVPKGNGKPGGATGVLGNLLQFETNKILNGNINDVGR